MLYAFYCIFRSPKKYLNDQGRKFVGEVNQSLLIPRGRGGRGGGEGREGGGRRGGGGGGCKTGYYLCIQSTVVARMSVTIKHRRAP